MTEERMTYNRRHLAEEERETANSWRNNDFVSSELRIQWQTVFNRMNVLLAPTSSASGSISSLEQIEYSELHNPRRWNLVKVDYGSNFYLSYLCPPTVNIDNVLRIVGGPHAQDVPHNREICVFNTESYWRELRHLMHKQVTFLREAVAA